IARFASYLRHHQQYDAYMDLLVNAFNPHTLEGLMCRTTLSVGWQGEVYDCDFNQMLDLTWKEGNYLWEIDPARVRGRAVLTGDHCFGCTAGCGSSCGGALTTAVSA